MSVLLALPIGVAYRFVSTLTSLLAPMPGGLAATAAIIVFTAAVRLLLLPLSYYAFRGERARARLAPRIQELQRRYHGQRDRLHRELVALQAAEGGGLLTGCLPALLQLPFFSVVYQLFLSPVIAGAPNRLLGGRLLGVSLGSHWLAGAGPFSLHGLVFAGLFLLLALVALVSVRPARHWAGSGAGQPGSPGGAAGMVARIVPFGTIAMAAIVPLAAGVYLLTSAAWATAERAVLRRLAPAPGPAAEPGAGKTPSPGRRRPGGMGSATRPD